ncbi:hypothetical protein PsorP6_007559 [Peronosclerospora sorghi]|uniref:Uncharacterized protein n=1 Tax=Peronosclerospora sorghi TaxID=230839 RepID=A0ACC0W9S7_9STRA|nr:hypothetical protein PsorP6_007559 [Peronosclerospora sorghi]
MRSLQKKMPSTRQLTSTISHFVQQKSVAVLYTPTEVERIKQMTEMISQATSEFEEDEDWDRILRVVDAFSSISNRAVLKESIRYLKLRLGDPSSCVVILALTLTESIVKNCGDLVHQEIASEPFMSEMEALYRTHSNRRGRDSMEIASRVLEMIQAWGEAFLPYRHMFPLFVDTYHNMRKKGVKFPDQYDESKVPVLMPSLKLSSEGERGAVEWRSVSSNNSHKPKSIDTSSYSNTSSGLGGLSTLELYRVATNVLEMFEDMLYEAQKNASCIVNSGVMEDLVVELRDIVHRMEGAIPIAVVEEDENLGKYLTVNDELHAALKKYDELLAKRQNAEAGTFKECKEGSFGEINFIDPFGDENVMSPQNHKTGSEFQEDPFADFVRARTSSKTDTAEETKLSTPEAGIEHALGAPGQAQSDDPFASFVKVRASKILSSSNQDFEKEMKPTCSVLQPAAPVKNLIDLWNAQRLAESQRNNSTTRSSDPFEMLNFSTQASCGFVPIHNRFQAYRDSLLLRLLSQLLLLHNLSTVIFTIPFPRSVNLPHSQRLCHITRSTFSC